MAQREVPSGKARCLQRVPRPSRTRNLPRARASSAPSDKEEHSTLATGICGAAAGSLTAVLLLLAPADADAARSGGRAGGRAPSPAPRAAPRPRSPAPRGPAAPRSSPRYTQRNYNFVAPPPSPAPPIYGPSPFFRPPLPFGGGVVLGDGIPPQFALMLALGIGIIAFNAGRNNNAGEDDDDDVF